MIAFAAAIFVSAFLIFQVQPLLGKYILPWFGGTPAVWTTCMLFFQVLLLAGYAYAHLSIRFFKPRVQFVVHALLLAGSLAFLPIIPREAFKPQGGEIPALQILMLLGATVGLPYIALSATGPLLQAWFSRAYPQKSPYALYALSNIGSLLGLLSFPFVFEPLWGRSDNAFGWSIGFGVFAVLCAGCALLALRRRRAEPSVGDPDLLPETPPRIVRALWIALPAVASALLLAITNQLCTDVASIPFLWVLPLSAYLLSFIIAFSGAWDVLRWPCLVISGILLAAVVMALLSGGVMPIDTQIQVWTSAVLICCLVCHGELYRFKPDPRLLTGYYLRIALGGALGGVFVGLVAPLIFNMYLELHLSLAAFAALIVLCLWLDKSHWMHEGVAAKLFLPLVIGLLTLMLALYKHTELYWFQTVHGSRNFFGAVRVQKIGEGTEANLTLFHGVITHGTQYADAERRRWPTTYFSQKSGAGLAILNFRREQAQRIGMVGLGAGTLAAYGRAGDVYRIYEINRDIVNIAKTQFSFLSDSPAQIEIVVGDARISMERELARGEPQKFDILALDAFSGDAVPVHLLTKEAFAVYFKHLADDGVLAVHISSLYFDLAPVVTGLAREFNASAQQVTNDGEKSLGISRSVWVLVSRNKDFLASPVIAGRAKPIDDVEGLRLWTDDYSNLLQVIDQKKEFGSR
ncbi:MAG: fused MFS/spermidine synthase [Planctomycetes bacterium]|nr:fused MFS/spermidine synthase [Planctomycetota bacterium]